MNGADVMKRVLTLILAFLFAFSASIIVVSAEEPDDDVSLMSLMPVNFSYSDFVILGSGFSFPAGLAYFDVTITGVYDINRDNVMSINTGSSVYRGGMNCHEHDVIVVTWKNVDQPNIVYWRLEGTITFSWTSPASGVQYETVFLTSGTYSFDAGDYC